MVAVVLPLSVSANDISRITVERDTADGAAKPSLRLALNVTIPIATLVDLLVKVQDIQKQGHQQSEQYDPKAMGKAKMNPAATPFAATGSLMGSHPALNAPPGAQAGSVPPGSSPFSFQGPQGLPQQGAPGPAGPGGKGGQVIPAKNAMLATAKPSGASQPGKAGEHQYPQPGKGAQPKMPEEDGAAPVPKADGQVSGDAASKREKTDSADSQDKTGASQDTGVTDASVAGATPQAQLREADSKTVHGIPGKKLAKLLKSITEVLIERKSDERVLVQSNSISMVKWLGNQLLTDKYKENNMFACLVHDELAPEEKERALAGFRSGEANVLVTTNDTFKAAKVTHMLTYDVASSIKLNIYFQKLEHTTS